MAGKRISFAARCERIDIAEVVPSTGDDVADAPAGIIHVAEVSRNHVEVQVHHGLSRGAASIEPHVVTVGMELVVEGGLHALDEMQDRETLMLARREPVRSDTPGDDQRVPGRDGMAIAEGERERVRPDPV